MRPSKSPDEQSDDDGPTAEQVAWVEIADELRERLRRRLEFVPTSAPTDCYQLVLALQAAYWLEVNCRSFDQHLASETDKTPWEE